MRIGIKRNGKQSWIQSESRAKNISLCPCKRVPTSETEITNERKKERKKPDVADVGIERAEREGGNNLLCKMWPWTGLFQPWTVHWLPLSSLTVNLSVWVWSRGNEGGTSAHRSLSCPLPPLPFFLSLSLLPSSFLAGWCAFFLPSLSLLCSILVGVFIMAMQSQSSF